MSKEKIIVHVECPAGHLSHAVNVRRDKDPPPSWAGGLKRRSFIQFEGSEGVPMGPSAVRWTSESSNS